MTPIFKKMALALSAFALVATTGMAYAAGGKSDYKMKHPHWHFDGPRGTFDRAAVQRGYQVYREVCAACHALEHVSFRHLGDKGGPYYSKDFKTRAIILMSKPLRRTGRLKISIVIQVMSLNVLLYLQISFRRYSRMMRQRGRRMAARFRLIFH